eukprot:g96.t1
MGKILSKGRERERERERERQGSSSRRQYQTGSEDDTGLSVDDAQVMPAVHSDAINWVSCVGPHHVLTCSDDRSFALHRSEKEQLALRGRFLGHTRAVNCADACAMDGVAVSCSRDRSIKMWRLSSFSSSSASSHVDVEDAERTIDDAHDLTISSVCMHSSGTQFCSGSRDTAVTLWDVESGKSLLTRKTPRNLVTCLGWIGGKTIAQGSEDLRVRVWDMSAHGAPAMTLQGYTYFPLCIDVSPDGNYILTGSKGFNGVGCELRLWDVRTGKQLKEMTGHMQDTTGVAFVPAPVGSSSSSLCAVSVSKDQTVRLWDVSEGRQLAEEHVPDGSPCSAVACSMDQRLVYASTAMGHLSIFRIRDDGQALKLCGKTG